MADRNKISPAVRRGIEIKCPCRKAASPHTPAGFSIRQRRIDINLPAAWRGVVGAVSPPSYRTGVKYPPPEVGG